MIIIVIFLNRVLLINSIDVHFPLCIIKKWLIMVKFFMVILFTASLVSIIVFIFY